MSPIVMIVFAPVVVVGLALVALLLGAVTACAWETVEESSELVHQTVVPRT